MNWLLRGLGFLVALMFVVGAAAINGVTAWHLGVDLWQKYVFAGIVIGAVICEALGVLFVRHHWQIGNRMLAIAGVMLMAGAAAYTVRMELRFFTESHSGMSGQRQAGVQDRNDYNADIARARQELSWTPQHRPATVVRTELASLTAKYNRSASAYCAMKSRWAVRTCRKLTQLKSELAMAQQAEKLKVDIARWSAAKRKAPVVADAMPEAAWLSRRLPVSRDSAADWLMVGGILFLLLARTIALPLAMTGGIRDRPVTRVASKLQDTLLLNQDLDLSHVERRPAGPDFDSSHVSNIQHLFPPDTMERSIDRYIHILRSAGGGVLSFPEIWDGYQRFCKMHSLKPEARNFLGKHLKSLGFKNTRPSPESGARVTVYDIPPLMKEAA